MTTTGSASSKTAFAAALWVAAACLVVSGCQPPTPQQDEQLVPASLAARAERRAFPGAPPVIPHPPQSSDCVACHAETAREVPRLGIAPGNPHLKTAGMSAASRCRQCHVFQVASDLFAASEFPENRRAMRKGGRAHIQAPPTIPHALFMREDCQSCHNGAAAPSEIRCSHAERMNCRQCHAAQSGELPAEFASTNKNAAIGSPGG